MIIQHVGLIPDGNRRWAEKNSYPLNKVYYKFNEHICNIITKVNELKIPEISIYLISKDNFQKRKIEDVSCVIKSIYILLSNMLNPIIKTTNARIKCIGNYYLLGESICSLINNIEKITKVNEGLMVNLLMAYDPFDEIKLSLKHKNELDITKLQVSKKVDLVIRTGGGPIRLSNFLPLQCAYASLCHINDYFLDLKIERLEEIINDFSKIEMRYGK